MSNHGHCLPELRHNFGKRTDKIEHEKIGARTEVSQDEDNSDQKVKWFLKFKKYTNFCGEHIFNYLFPSFNSPSHFTNFTIFTLLKMRVKLVN